MDLIDRRLAELGFSSQVEGLWHCNYVRKRYDFDDEIGRIESDYHQIVEIHSFLDKQLKRHVVVSSHILGESCAWGYHCSAEITDEEMWLFFLKAKKLKLIWSFKDFIFKLKRRLIE